MFVVLKLFRPLQQLEQHKKSQARKQQGTEEPECASQKLVVARHIHHDAPQVLTELMEGERMCHPAFGIAKVFAEQSAVEQQVVNNEEKHTPTQKGEIEPFQSANHKGAFVRKIARVEEKACAEKEYRHMENEYEVEKPSADACVGEHYEHDGQSLDNGKLRVAHDVWYVFKKRDNGWRNGFNLA